MDESQFQLRLVVAYVFMLLMFCVLVGRFVWLQVYQHDRFTTMANNNRISLVPILPNRGLIMDRNGVILAQNYSAYTLELTPSKMPDLDATVAELSKLVDITPRDEKRFKKLLGESRDFESVPLKVKLSDEEAARVAANAWRFPGVEVKARLFRDYPYKELTSHVLGYIGRINQKDQDRLDEEDKTTNYKGTNYIGKTGLENVYEDDLHGEVGFEEVETDSGGHAHGSCLPSFGKKKLILAVFLNEYLRASLVYGSIGGTTVCNLYWVDFVPTSVEARKLERQK